MFSDNFKTMDLKINKTVKPNKREKYIRKKYSVTRLQYEQMIFLTIRRVSCVHSDGATFLAEEYHWNFYTNTLVIF